MKTKVTHRVAFSIWSKYYFLFKREHGMLYTEQMFGILLQHMKPRIQYFRSVLLE